MQILNFLYQNLFIQIRERLSVETKVVFFFVQLVDLLKVRFVPKLFLLFVKLIKSAPLLLELRRCPFFILMEKFLTFFAIILVW